ncbi:MAG: YkgJ family cysteine cluster protein [Promethearchaeota archaeon]|nr:MAG: YkgJ family cysteine cluster protein [Candidatus Lokiarchaeota archaeon]
MCNISKILNLNYVDFAKRYLKITPYDFTLWDANLKDTGKKKMMRTLILNFDQKQDCIFLKKQEEKFLCQIYQARPQQCELYPFWSMIMTSEVTFQDHRLICPGFHVPKEEAEFFTPDHIQRLVNNERRIERDYFLAMKAVNFDIMAYYPFLKDVSALDINK